MNETQKKFLKRLCAIMFLIAFIIAFFYGVAFQHLWAKIVFILAMAGLFGFLMLYWICSAINEWQIMGVLTPKEYQVYKWHKPFSSGYAPGIYANKCRDPEVKRIFNKAATAKRIRIFDN